MQKESVCSAAPIHSRVYTEVRSVNGCICQRMSLNYMCGHVEMSFSCLYNWDFMHIHWQCWDRTADCSVLAFTASAGRKLFLHQVPLSRGFHTMPACRHTSLAHNCIFETIRTQIGTHLQRHAGLELKKVNQQADALMFKTMPCLEVSLAWSPHAVLCSPAYSCSARCSIA